MRGRQEASSSGVRAGVDARLAALERSEPDRRVQARAREEKDRWLAGPQAQCLATCHVCCGRKPE